MVMTNETRRRSEIAALVADIEAAGEEPTYEAVGPATVLYGVGYTGHRWWVPHPRNPLSHLIHRVDAPAAIDGICEEWRIANEYHRIDGPAFIFNSRKTRVCREWWIYGVKVRSFEEYQELTGCSDEDILLYKLKYGDISQWL